jgi:CHASE3 domain sensor protein
MSKIKRILPILLTAGALFVLAGCASEQAEYTTNRVTNSTSNTVDSVLDATGHVIMYPFHLVGDLFS